MKHVPILAGVVVLASCASTSTVSPPPESLPPMEPMVPIASEPAPVEPAQQASGPVTVATPDPLPSSRVSIMLGFRGLDAGVWAPVEDQFMFGVEFAQEHPGDVLGWEVGAGFGLDSATVGPAKVTSTTAELYGGARKTFMDPAGDWHPYVAGGLSFINGDFDVAGFSENDTSLGIYLHGGILLDISDDMYLGLDLRTLFGSSITIAGVNGDANYTQLAFMVGWAF